MEPTTTTALIAASSAISAAFLTSFFNARAQKKNMVLIEKLKAELEEEKINKQSLRKTNDKVIESMDMALQCTQKIKDNISIVIGVLRFKDKLTIEWLQKNQDEIQHYINLFSEIFTKLNNFERSLLHDLKKDLTAIRQIFARLIHQKKEFKHINEEHVVQVLNQTRTKLSEFQHNLLVRKSIYSLFS